MTRFLLALVSVCVSGLAPTVARAATADDKIESVVVFADRARVTRARAVRCTPEDSHDKRVFMVDLPAGARRVEPGDVLWVVHPADKPDPVFSAAWFDRDLA